MLTNTIIDQHENWLINSLSIALSERFTKQEITDQGYKLAFIDINIIQEQNYDLLAKFFRNKKIKPILTEAFIAEFLQGLKDDKKDKFLPIKQKFMKLFQEVGTVWALPYQIINVIELLNCMNPNLKPASKRLKVFSHYPLATALSNQCKNKTKSYDCDIGLNVKMLPVYEIMQARGDFEKYTHYYVENLQNSNNELYKGKENNVSATNYILEKLLANNSLQQSELLVKIKAHLLKEFSIFNYDDCYQIVKRIMTDINLLDKSLLLRPHDIISDSIFIQAIKSGYNLDKQGRNSFIDDEHTKVSLSYGDIIISNDKGLISKCQKIKNNLKLQIEIYNLDRIKKEINNDICIEL